MNPNESWIAEQVRLLTLEDGFGPSYAPESGGSSFLLVHGLTSLGGAVLDIRAARLARGPLHVPGRCRLPAIAPPGNRCSVRFVGQGRTA